MDTAEKRLADTLYDLLSDELPDDFYDYCQSKDFHVLLARACRQSKTRVIEHGPPSEQDEYRRQLDLGWEYHTSDTRIGVVPADQA